MRSILITLALVFSLSTFTLAQNNDENNIFENNTSKPLAYDTVLLEELEYEMNKDNESERAIWCVYVSPTSAICYHGWQHGWSICTYFYGWRCTTPTQG